MTVLINKYSDYIKKKHGERVQKVSIDAGFTCPNRDGKVATGGCTYCNNDSFVPIEGKEKSVTAQINESLPKLKSLYNAKKFIAYFQAYSNTYAPLSHLQNLYGEALSHQEVIGLAIGTRPDCIDSDILDYLEELSKTYDITLEYGLESFNDKTLQEINRGHDVHSFYKAVEETHQRKIPMCVHLILGLPGENQDEWLKWPKLLSDLPIHSIKLHQLHVVKHTKLGSDYLKKPFSTLTELEYINILIQFLELTSPTIFFQRLFGTTPRRLLLSPSWEHSPYECQKILEQEMILRGTYQGRLFKV